jgi:hypothetical protein
MKGYATFKGYLTKLVFDAATQRFVSVRVEMPEPASPPEAGSPQPAAPPNTQPPKQRLRGPPRVAQRGLLHHPQQNLHL